MKTTSTLFKAPSIRKINQMPKKYKAVSFFAGCGGASIGYKLAGYEVLYANEFIPIAAETYKANGGTTLVDTRDVREINPTRLMKQLGIKAGELDLLDGSPPCLAFSLVGTRDKQWGEVKDYSEGVKQRVDDLFDEYLRMVKAFKAKVIVAENVPGLAMGKAQGYLIEIIEKLEATGYTVDARIVDAASLGLPQHRRRLIIIGIRNDIYKKLKLTSVPYPKPSNKLHTVQTVLPNIQRIRVASDAGATTFVPASRPSPTIVASDGTNSLTGRFSCGAFVDTVDGERRKYTIKELLVLFGFPADFKLLGKYEQQVERLGRSHSPASTYWIGRTLAQEILDKL